MSDPLQDILGQTLANMVRAPNPPPDLRGHILAKTGLWVPNNTIDIAAFVLANTKPALVATAQPAPTTLTISTEWSGTEDGCCRFTRQFSSTGTVEITEEE